jgi:2-oxoglutarate ferredoxin oxidoreductase subunit gamma
MERVRIVFTGAGGHGVITAAIILAESAVLREGLEATQTQAYGPEARGGATRADVIIADSPIRYPKVIQPNVLVCLTQESYNKYNNIIRPGGILLSDSRAVKTHSKVDARQIELPMYESVMKEIGKPIVLNMCMLGAVVGITNVVKLESVTRTLEGRIPGALLRLNKKALKLGYSLAPNGEL